MKMIYVGELKTTPDRDSVWLREFRNIGWKVIPFSTEYQTASRLLEKFYRRLHIGPANKEMQQALLVLVQEEKPAWVHFRLPIEFDRQTIMKVKSDGIVVTQYFNDDPFSHKSRLGLHWKFRRALNAYDGHFVFRERNISSYRRSGASHVEHCPPFYDPERHTPAQRRHDQTFLADAAFIGHWENDWRVNCLDALCAAGYSLILKGSYWDRAIRHTNLSYLSPVGLVFDLKYNEIYANALAGLCFFSKINNDTWTRRALEIVAVGGLLVCERTEEAQTYFRDREEAFFFSSIEELIEINALLKTDLVTRTRVQKAGYARLIQDGHTICNRAKQVDLFIENELAKKPLAST